MLSKRCQIAAEIEASEGVAETLEAADAFLAFNPKFTPAIDMHKRSPARTSMSPYPSLPGARSAKISFDVELVGTSSAGNPIHFSDVLRACGVDETLVAGTSATYSPASDAIPSATIAMYMDGKIYKLWGARGSAKLALDAGKPGIFSFEFTGADFSDVDGNFLAGISLNSVLPPVFMNAGMTIDAYAATISKVGIDLGNAVALRKDANSVSGHKSAVVSGKDSTISFDPENVLVATEDFMGNWRDGSQMAFATTLGSAAGNTISITAPKVQYQGVTMGERDGVSTLDISGLLTADAGDDEWQIQIT